MAGVYEGSIGDDIIAPGLVSAGVTVHPGSSPTPDAGSDTILGQSGDDTLVGAGGGDIILGNFGDDVIDVRSGDTVNGYEEADLLRVFSAGAGTSIDGGSGNDTLEAQGTLDLSAADIAGIEVLALDGSMLTLRLDQLAGIELLAPDGDATEGMLTLLDGGTAAVTVEDLDRLSIFAGDDSQTLTIAAALFGPDADILVAAAGGDDVVATAGGRDTLLGGDGNDLLDGDGGRDRLEGGDGDDTLLAGAGDSVFGGADDDEIRLVESLTAPGTLSGGSGDDTLVAPAARSLDPGIAILSVETLGLALGPVTLAGAQLDSFDLVRSLAGPLPGGIVLSAAAAGTVSVQVVLMSGFTLTGSTGDDMLDLTTATANPVAMAIDGGEGADSIAAGRAADTLHGGADDDTLDGREGADALRGDAGNDLLILRNGDNADGGSQDDVLLVTGNLSLAATLAGGEGTDALAVAGEASIAAAVTLTGLETLALGGGTLRLHGAQLGGFEAITGLDGATSATLELASATTASLQVSGLTALTVLGAGGPDSLSFTQPGADPTDLLVQAGTGDDVVLAGAGTDTLIGESGRDELDGGDGADLLIGGGAKDSLEGGAGDDSLVGQDGSDRLRGGAGADRFRYEVPADGRDRIVDFTSGEDLLAISAAGFGGGLAAGQALTATQLVVQASKQATAPFGTGQFIFDTRKGMLLWDADGDGGDKAVKLAKLPDVAALDLSDVVILA